MEKTSNIKPPKQTKASCLLLSAVMLAAPSVRVNCLLLKARCRNLPRMAEVSQSLRNSWDSCLDADKNTPRWCWETGMRRNSNSQSFFKIRHSCYSVIIVMLPVDILSEKVWLSVSDLLQAADSEGWARGSLVWIWLKGIFSLIHIVHVRTQQVVHNCVSEMQTSPNAFSFSFDYFCSQKTLFRILLNYFPIQINILTSRIKSF